MNNFALRTITGAVFVILIIGSVILNHWAFSALFLIVSLGGYLEFVKISGSMNARPPKFAGLVVSSLTYLLIHAGIMD